jgi:hypothetical protein
MMAPYMGSLERFWGFWMENLGKETQMLFRFNMMSLDVADDIALPGMK